MRAGKSLERSAEVLLKAGPGRRIVLEPTGAVRKTFSGGSTAEQERIATEELTRLTLFSAALAAVPGATSPRPLGAVHDPGPGYRMTWVAGEDLCTRLTRAVPDADLLGMGATIARALVAYVEAVGEPYTDLKLGNVLVGPDGELAFCDVGLPDGDPPPLHRETAYEVSVGNLLASLVFDSTRPAWIWKRRMHRQSALLATALVAELAAAGHPLDDAALRTETELAYRRNTYDRGGLPLVAWYATVGRLTGIRVRTPAGVLGPAPYRRS